MAGIRALVSDGVFDQSRLDPFLSPIFEFFKSPIATFGILALVLIGLFLASRALRKLGELERRSGFDRLGAVLGRLEKLERQFNDTRTEVLRNAEESRREFLETCQNLRREIERSREVPGDGSKRLPSGSSTALASNAPVDFPSSDPSSGTYRRSSTKEAAESTSTSGRRMPPRQDVGASGSLLRPYQETVAAPLPTQVQIQHGGSVQPDAPVGLFAKLGQTRSGLLGAIRNLFGINKKLEQEQLDELEAVLIAADLGVTLTNSLLGELRTDVSQGAEVSEKAVKALLKMKLLGRLDSSSPLEGEIKPVRREDAPTVILVVGVNGAGKTTTSAKLAARFKKQGAKVLLVAADTFRAAAVEQLVKWAERLQVAVISGKEGAKPSTVVFDAMIRATEEDFDVIIIDTAGRLHTKANLMQELEGVRNVISRHFPQAPHEVLLVLDGSTGQNALLQAREFHGSVKLTGLVITKLDGTAKGGVVVAIKDELSVPVRYIGVGESSEDLRPFDSREFVEAMLSEDSTTLH